MASAMLEAEVKVRLPAARRALLADRLRELGATPRREHLQVDTYLAHPTRDFAATDEALRLRLANDRLVLTYKGAKLDPPRKTREEIEFPLGTDLETATRLFARLGFTPVATVRKRRSDFALSGAHGATTVSLDEVEGLGSFCEIEVAARDVAGGREALAVESTRLGLADLAPIAESYLELLLAGGGTAPQASRG
jgi:adenylate cyclase class 2